ncbi:MAG: glycosyltransferase [Actinobacteria bacterium]|nr:glycosyltransferase [Actinomycetota bacterium]
MTSIVVPAHDEEASIAACLSSLLSDAAEDEFEVVVVCNGCTDGTAEVASGFGDAVTVLQTPIASKIRALSLGDREATRFPRLYVDADVTLDTASVRALTAALAQPGTLALAVSPRPAYQLAGVGWAVRSYYRIWQHLPGVRAGVVGAGVYGLSAAGRTRLGDFPEVLGDDYFVQQRFQAHERRVVHEAVSRIDPPASVRELVRRKVRVFVGNRQLADLLPAGTSTARWTGCMAVVRDQPRLVPHVPAFAAVTVIAKIIAWWRYRRGTWRGWSGRGGRGRHGGQLPLEETGPDSDLRDASPLRPHVAVIDGSHDTWREFTR